MITVRPATPADFETVAEISHRAYDAAGQLEPGSPYVLTLRDAAARAQDAVLLVAEREDRVVGTVTICPPGSTFHEIGRDDELEFRFLAVHPDAWRSGVGVRLVDACEEVAREQGARHLVISVRDINAGAREMYVRLGFESQPGRDWSPRAGVDLEVLRRPVA